MDAAHVGMWKDEEGDAAGGCRADLLADIAFVLHTGRYYQRWEALRVGESTAPFACADYHEKPRADLDTSWNVPECILSI